MAETASDHGLIGQRRARSLSGARRRSRLIAYLRHALVGGMGLIGLNIGVQLVLNAASGGEVGAGLAPPSAEERIVNPRFTGRDEGGAPFTLTADAAVRRSGGVAGLAELDRPALDYAFLSSGDASAVLSRAGVYDEAEQTLQLSEDVRLETRSGYAFDTQSALIRLREGRAEGDAPVRGTAPWGAIRGDAFQVRDGGRRIILTGDVRTRIDMDPSQEAQP